MVFITKNQVKFLKVFKIRQQKHIAKLFFLKLKKFLKF